MEQTDYIVVWAGGSKVFSALLPAIYFAQRERDANYINPGKPREISLFRVVTISEELEITRA